ncbi:hypothetical protein LJC56_11985 [Christensenellaceae bacterium OttesenSCG-928-K19]|nr:hypothetical protein [Christensenellaceae bacterium OttesenSCG-928-K19]
MDSKIFVLHGENQLSELVQTRYESEDIFQTLIEQYPDILAGDQINPDHPCKWILINREMGVPSEQSGNAQWFLDHLFIDQEAIPTLVEVKRSTDTRIRREVVAQMLDYAANATQYWSIDIIRNAYMEQTANISANTLADIGIHPEAEDSFWETVQTNLRAGKIRLMFVADEIPKTLQAIIEFLNDQMVQTEVLGLEIKQYISNDGIKTLVPRIIGNTTKAVQTKKQESKEWDEESFLESVTSTSGKEIADICHRLISSLKGCKILFIVSVVNRRYRLPECSLSKNRYPSLDFCAPQFLIISET